MAEQSPAQPQTPLQNEERIISPKEARKLLGAEFQNIQDEEIISIIRVLGLLAETLLNLANGSTKLTQTLIQEV